MEDQGEARIWETILLACMPVLHASLKDFGQPSSPEAPALAQACLQLLRVSAGTITTNLRALT